LLALLSAGAVSAATRPLSLPGALPISAEAAEWDRIDAQTLHVDMSAADRDTYHRRILADIGVLVAQIEMPPERQVLLTDREATIDRKSTRLNSTHAKISYAVFCSKTNT